jgi:L-methionine (R)-S-oxide reductase
MVESISLPQNAPREQIYQTLIPQLKSLIKDEHDLIANLANTTSALKMAFGFFWIGFYRMIDNELVLGPFQGSLACTRIALSKGVCGACATTKRTIVVADVEKFPGHIACSSLSKSEIVVPLIQNDEVRLVLDIDSDKLNDFSDIDARYLEEIVELLGDLHSS